MDASKLEGAELDAAVAKAEGLEPIAEQPPGFFYWTDQYGNPASGRYSPSTDGAIGIVIIDRECIELQCGDAIVGMKWFANIAIVRDCDTPSGEGPTPLIAAMRAYVASKR